jgi:large conductance mechanosensitive channel
VRTILKEFREFAVKGNVVDLAVGIIIGAAFNSLINSLVNDIIMPIPGAIIHGINFSNYFISLDGKVYDTLKAAQDAGAPVIKYGLFINNAINFLIVAWVVFLLVRAVNQLRRQAEGAPKEGPKDKECPFCHTSIPIKAIRCPNCTSDLSQTPAASTL